MYELVIIHLPLKVFLDIFNSTIIGRFKALYSLVSSLTFIHL